jgi:hypothetical protein
MRALANKNSAANGEPRLQGILFADAYSALALNFRSTSDLNPLQSIWISSDEKPGINGRTGVIAAPPLMEQTLPVPNSERMSQAEDWPPVQGSK